MSENTNEKLTVEDLNKGSDSYCESAIKDFLVKLGFSEAAASPFREGQYDILFDLTAKPADWIFPEEGGYYCQVLFPDVFYREGGILPLKENLTLVEHFPDDDGVSKFEIYHEPIDRVIEAFNVEMTPVNQERLENAIDLMHAADKNIGHFMDRTEIASTQEGKEVEASRMAMMYLFTAAYSIERRTKQRPDYWLSDGGRFENGFNLDWNLSNVIDSLGLTGDLPKEQQAQKIAEIASLATFTDKDPWIVAQTLEERNVNVTESQLNELGKQAISNGFILTAQDVLDAVPELGQAKDVDRGR